METVHGAGGAAAGRVFRGVVSLSWSSAVSPQSSWVPPLLARQPPAEREREFVWVETLGEEIQSNCWHK